MTFNVNELSRTSRDLFGEQAEGMHSALADKIVDVLFALITAGNFANNTTSTLAEFARKKLTTIARKLYQRKLSSMGRFALLAPEFYEKLGDDSAIVSLAAFQKPELITGYGLPPVAGFQIDQAVSLPNTGDLVGFAGNARALALATRLPNDYTLALPGVPSNGLVRSVLNQETGITVQLVQFVDHNLAKATSRVALMFGAAVGDPTCGERIVEVEPEA